MSADNANGHNGHEDDGSDREPDWESIAREAVAQMLFDRRHDLEDSLGSIETSIDTYADSDLNAEDIQEFRNNFYALQSLIEENTVPLVDGLEPYEQATKILPGRQKANALGLNWEDIRDLPRTSEIGDEGEGS